jgi:hypothetical protein
MRLLEVGNCVMRAGAVMDLLYAMLIQSARSPGAGRRQTVVTPGLAHTTARSIQQENVTVYTCRAGLRVFAGTRNQLLTLMGVILLLHLVRGRTHQALTLSGAHLPAACVPGYPGCVGANQHFPGANHHRHLT